MLDKEQYKELMTKKRQNSFGTNSETDKIFEVKDFITMDSMKFTQDYNISNFMINESYLFGDLYPVVIADENNDMQLFDSVTTLTLSLSYHELKTLVESNSNLTNSTLPKEVKPYIIDPYLYRYPPNEDGEFDLKSNMTFTAKNGEFKLPKIYLQGTPGT